VIDAVTERLFGKPFDRDGRIAHPEAWWKRLWPMSARGLFSQEAAENGGARGVWARICRDVLAAVRADGQGRCRGYGHGAHRQVDRGCDQRFVLKRGAAFHEFVMSGGGASNPTLLAMLANELRPLGLSVRLSDEFGLPSAAKEAPRLRCWLTRRGIAGLRTCLRHGAKRAAILGKISYA